MSTARPAGRNRFAREPQSTPSTDRADEAEPRIDAHFSRIFWRTGEEDDWQICAASQAIVARRSEGLEVLDQVALLFGRVRGAVVVAGVVVAGGLGVEKIGAAVGVAHLCG